MAAKKTVAPQDGARGERHARWPTGSRSNRSGHQYNSILFMSDTVGDYRLLEQIGAGALGPVYRARDTGRGRTVAIKLVPETITGDPDRRRALLTDARAAAGLSHQNITALFAVGEDGPRVFLVFEHVTGPTLRSVIGDQPLNVRRALDLGVQLADALAEGHRKGIVHGSLDPAAVIVTATGRAKVMNFGLARWTDEDPSQARPQTTDGDLVSLGAILYEMLTGRSPLIMSSAAATATGGHAVADIVPFPSTVNPVVPTELDRIVGRALIEAAEQRYTEAAQLAADLQQMGTALEERRQAAARGPGPSMVQRHRPPSAVPVRLLVVLVVLVLLAAGGWVWRDEMSALWRRVVDSPATRPPEG